MTYCTRCGHEIADGANFCTMCGEHVHAAASPLAFGGEFESTVYVYDARPLPRLGVGDSFVARVVPGDVVLESIYTGTVTDTSGFCAALSYRGGVFGATSGRLKCLKEIAARGVPVAVEVKKVGMYSESIPDLVAVTAEPDDIWDALRDMEEADRS